MVIETQKTSWGKIEWLHKPVNLKESMSVGVVVVDPKAKELEHVHFSDEQCLITLSGEGVDYINGKPFEPNQWRANYFPVGCTHYSENIGEEPLVQLLISNPIKEKCGFNQNSDKLLEEEVESLGLTEGELERYIGMYIASFDGSSIPETKFPMMFFTKDYKKLYTHLLPESCCDRCSLKEDGHICERSMEHYLSEIKNRKAVDIDTIICPRGKLTILCEVNLAGSIIGYLQCGFFEAHSDIVESTLNGIIKMINEISTGIKMECKEAVFMYAIDEGSSRLADEAEKQNLMKVALEKSQNRLLSLDINNHFLFNTLTAIAALAMKDGSIKTYNAIQELSDMFRGKLQKSGEMVSLETDIENTKNYISLMKLRMYDDVKVLINIPEECKKVKIPYNFMQPIIENSLIHGFEKTFGRPFALRIQASKNEYYLELEIEDNGCGMDMATLKKLKELAYSNETHGIGMVYSILKQTYGDNFKVSVSSKEKQGTKFKISIPC